MIRNVADLTCLVDSKQLYPADIREALLPCRSFYGSAALVKRRFLSIDCEAKTAALLSMLMGRVSVAPQRSTRGGSQHFILKAATPRSTSLRITQPLAEQRKRLSDQNHHLDPFPLSCSTVRHLAAAHHVWPLFSSTRRCSFDQCGAFRAQTDSRALPRHHSNSFKGCSKPASRLLGDG